MLPPLEGKGKTRCCGGSKLAPSARACLATQWAAKTGWQAKNRATSPGWLAACRNKQQFLCEALQTRKGSQRKATGCDWPYMAGIQTFETRPHHKIIFPIINDTRKKINSNHNWHYFWVDSWTSLGSVLGSVLLWRPKLDAIRVPFQDRHGC